MNLGFEQLGGLAPQIEALREIIELESANANVLASLGIRASKGILLSGPPGTGKTLTAQALANQNGDAFILRSCSDFFSKHAGDGENALKQVFKRAASKAPAIIFLDEVDTIAQHRSGSDEEFRVRLTNTFLELLDGVDSKAGITVIGATNRIEAIDSAFRRAGRFDVEIPYFVPTGTELSDIYRAHLRHFPDDIRNRVDPAALAAGSAGFVGADVAAVVRRAVIGVLRNGRGVQDLSADNFLLAASGHISTLDRNRLSKIFFPKSVQVHSSTTPVARVFYEVSREREIENQAQHLSEHLGVPLIMLDADPAGMAPSVEAAILQARSWFRQFAVWFICPAEARASAGRVLHDRHIRPYGGRIPLVAFSMPVPASDPDWQHMCDQMFKIG